MNRLERSGKITENTGKVREFQTNVIYYFYRPQTKFAKVMFLQVTVCHHGGAWVVLLGVGGCAWFYSGGHAWFYLGGAWFYSGACMVLFRGVCMVLFRGACVVLFRGRAWFYLGFVHGFIWGVCVVFLRGRAWFFWGACVVFSVFSDTMIYGQ